MNGVYEGIKRWATPRNVTVSAVLLIVSVVALARLDQPLLALAGGEPKLDLRFGYDLPTVLNLLERYGEAGRRTYAWNLVVDTPFPILLSLTAVLMAGLAFHRKTPVLLLSIAPLVFVVFDLIENVLFWIMLGAHPDISAGYVAICSVITQIKRAAYYPTDVVLFGSFFIVLAGWAWRSLQRRRSSPPV